MYRVAAPPLMPVILARNGNGIVIGILLYIILHRVPVRNGIRVRHPVGNLFAHAPEISRILQNWKQKIPLRLYLI